MSEKKSKEWEKVLETELSDVDESTLRIHRGKLLPRLSSYPKSIEDNDVYTLFGNLHVPALVREETQLPSKPHIRQLIRESGRTLYFKRMRQHIVGVMDDLLICQDSKKKV